MGAGGRPRRDVVHEPRQVGVAPIAQRAHLGQRQGASPRGCGTRRCAAWRRSLRGAHAPNVCGVRRHAVNRRSWIDPVFHISGPARRAGDVGSSRIAEAIAPPRTSRRVPELDGLRGIAILLVLEDHFGVLRTPLQELGLDQVNPLLSLGWSGVDLFFVLSGFLLGGILMDHKGASNYFRVFYTRRVCRIFPLYFVVVIPLLLVPLPSIGGPLGGSLPSWTYPTFTQNLAMAAENSGGSTWLVHTWSIAVEEQFYLLLPFLIALVSWRRLPRLVLALMLVCGLVRVALVHGDTNPAEVATATVLLPFRADALLLGILAAWAMRNARWRNRFSRYRGVIYAVLLLLLAIVAVLAFGTYSQARTGVFHPLYGYTLLALLFGCAVILAVTERRGPIAAISRNRALRKLGIISYAVYLLQLPVSLLVHWALRGTPGTATRGGAYLVAVGALVVSVGLAAASWRFFERRIVDWGRSFRYSHAPA